MRKPPSPLKAPPSAILQLVGAPDGASRPNDGWENAVTGFGTSRDKTTYGRFLRSALLDYEPLSDLYHVSDPLGLDALVAYVRRAYVLIKCQCLAHGKGRQVCQLCKEQPWGWRAVRG